MSIGITDLLMGHWATRRTKEVMKSVEQDSRDRGKRDRTPRSRAMTQWRKGFHRRAVCAARLTCRPTSRSPIGPPSSTPSPPAQPSSRTSRSRTIACPPSIACAPSASPGLWRTAGAEAAKLTITGRGLDGLRESADVLDARNSGTTMRLLAGLLAGRPFLSILTGDESLRSRPMATDH